MQGCYSLHFLPKLPLFLGVRKENDSNSSVKASPKSSKENSSREAETEGASQRSDLHDQDDSQPVEQGAISDLS